MSSEKENLLHYVLQQADNSMIIGQRNSEWCGHGPVLEQDIALTNISLDLIGEARSLYQYAAELAGNGNTEDSMAFLRHENDYKNLLITEYPNTDWAYTIIRQFLFDTFHYYQQEALVNSKDLNLKQIASKTIKEAAYHMKWSSEWTIRLGDGTDISKNKMQTALNELWQFTGEMFLLSEADKYAISAGIGADPLIIKEKWDERISKVLKEAQLELPQSTYMQKGGKMGYHTEHMGFLLSEMQYLQRAYPGAEW